MSHAVPADTFTIRIGDTYYQVKSQIQLYTTNNLLTHPLAWWALGRASPENARIAWWAIALAIVFAVDQLLVALAGEPVPSAGFISVYALLFGAAEAAAIVGRGQPSRGRTARGAD